MNGRQRIKADMDTVFDRYFNMFQQLAKIFTAAHFRDEKGNPQGLIVPANSSYIIINPVMLSNGSIAHDTMSPLESFLITGDEALKAKVQDLWENYVTMPSNGELDTFDPYKLMNNPTMPQVYRTDKKLAIFPGMDMRNAKIFPAEKISLDAKGRLPDTYDGPLRKDISYKVL